jgi:single-stranded-DNA-specific exonuclease
MKWQIKENISQDFINRFPEIDPVILQLLWNRGIKIQEQIDEFLYPDYSQDIHDPFIFLEMRQAVERVFLAIKNKEKIMVHGDYDADGVCSALIMVTFLEAIGADVDVYLPHRELEGYGLNAQSVEEFAKNNINLIITTDCGISNREEVKKAKELGMDIIITDHHAEPPILPEGAVAIINPQLKREKYPFCDLSGSGVAFKFVEAMLREIQIRPDEDFRIKPEEADIFEKWLLDLVAIGTITDMMPIVGENRTLVKYGLIVLNKTRRIGLKKLIESLGGNKNNKILDVRNIAFQIGPRLNAAGRINHANQAYDLLRSEKSEEVSSAVENLNKTNTERQTLSERVTSEVKEQIGETRDQKVLFALGKDWPMGIVGLVAGKVTENFWRPTFVSVEKEGIISGSGRSIPEFDITAALQEAKEYLSRYGGHSGACGFTLKNKKDYESFKKKIIEIAEEKLKGIVLEPTLEIDAEVRLGKINWDLFELLEKFSPFGRSNERPRYLARGLRVDNIEPVGSNGNHLRMMLSQGNGERKKFIGFCMGDWCERIKVNDKIDVIFEVDANEWNGNRELQLKIVDLKLNEPPPL